MNELWPGEQLHPFPGGLKLRHFKQAACRHPLERLASPERLILPLQLDELGTPGGLLAAPGDRVVRGQRLSDGAGSRAVSLHAPACGSIASIEDHPVAWPPGTTAPCLVIDVDPGDDSEQRIPLDDWRIAEPAELVAHIRERGLAGLGGAMFPTADKLAGNFPAIHTVILNGAECEPWIACDEMLMRNRAADIITGGRILARATDATRVVIAIEDQMGEVARAFETGKAGADPDGMVDVVKVMTIYPEGGERQLIQVLTGREVPHDGLPQDLGVVCVNVATACAVRDATIDGRAVIERIVTVTGTAVAEPRNLIVSLGTPVSALLQAAGGFRQPPERLILGGPMSGLPLACDDIPVTKGTNCILALTAEDIRRGQPQMPCINCGECVRVCPARLLPQTLYRHISAGDLDTAEDLDLFDCIECGCCAHVCPSHIPLVDYYRHGKDELIRQGRESARARTARERHEQRQRRLEKEKLERREKRRKREARLARSGGAQNEVAAALERARRKKTESNPSTDSDDDNGGRET